MKKALVVAIAFAMVIGLMGCGNYTEDRNIEGVGIPSQVSYIQFDNGGRVALEAENATVKILVQSNSAFVSLSAKGNQVQFYVYEIVGKLTLYKGDGSVSQVSNGKIKIVDSESLAITFIE